MFYTGYVIKNDDVNTGKHKQLMHGMVQFLATFQA